MGPQTVRREYAIRSTVPSLYRFISTPIGLSQWICDRAEEVDSKKYAIYWGKSESFLTVIAQREGHFIHYLWDDGNRLEMSIIKNELTNSIALVITEDVAFDDVQDTCKLWDYNIKRLKSRLGTGE